MSDFIDPKFKNTIGDFWANTLAGQSSTTDWDKLILGPFQLPGLWSVEVDSPHEYIPHKLRLNETGNPDQDAWDITTTDAGGLAARLTATGRLWTVEQWQDLKSMMPKIYAKRTIGAASPRKSFDINHPAANMLGVMSVLIDSVRILPPVDQTLFVQVSMQQKFKMSQQTGSYSGHGTGETPVKPAPNTSGPR